MRSTPAPAKPRAANSSMAAASRRFREPAGIAGFEAFSRGAPERFDDCPGRAGAALVAS